MTVTFMYSDKKKPISTSHEEMGDVKNHKRPEILNVGTFSKLKCSKFTEWLTIKQVVFFLVISANKKIVIIRYINSVEQLIIDQKFYKVLSSNYSYIYFQ